MAKAIQITEENRNSLIQQYGVHPDDDDFVNGLYIVALFGGAAIEGLLTLENLNERWVRTGVELNNDWFEVKKPQHIAIA